MGLDMYLTTERWLSQWDEKDKAIIEKIDSMFPYKGIFKPSVVRFQAGYWRKVNCVHKWFVDNVQKGDDDCGHYDVSTDDLRNLLSICKKVLETKNPALLPPQEGFFFGSTEIDEYYWGDIDYTIELLEKILSAPNVNEIYFEYHSSW